MRKLITIARNEFMETMRNKMLVGMVFGVPLVIWLIFLGVSAIQDYAVETEKATLAATVETEKEGFIDPTGIIRTMPAGIPSEVLVSYPDETAARQALNKGEINAFYIIPRDYVDSGKLVVIRRDYQLDAPDNQAAMINLVLAHNLVEGDVGLLARLNKPIEVSSTNLALDPQDKRGEFADTTVGQGLPLIMVVIFFMLITTASGQLLRSIAREKENRIMEILMTSVTPRQLVTGKTIGLGVFGLLQAIAWVGTLYGLLRVGGKTLNLPEGFSLPPSIIAWAILFSVFGYALYASLLAGAGAMISNMKEITTASWTAMAPLIVGYMLTLTTQEVPNTLVPTVLSFIPFSSPIAMMMRLGVVAVPLWQPLLSLTLLAVMTYFVNRAAAKLFRAQNLLSGQPFSVRRFYQTLFGLA